MQYEPRVDRTDLIEAIQASYGLLVTTLIFVPVGFATSCYTIDCAGGERYFLKLWLDGNNEEAHAARRSILRLMQAMDDRKLFVQLPAPILTRQSELSATCLAGSFALFPFISGQEPAGPLAPAVRDQWARAMAAVHQATAALVDVLPPQETFEISLEPELLHALALLEQVGLDSRPELQALRDLLLPRRAEIMAQLERLHSFQGIARQLSVPLVLCHTDMGGTNLLVTAQGKLWVLDWDEALVAPPEHDLHEARGEGFADFLASYGAAGGAHPLHLDHFAFYLLRRHLGDMLARVERILYEQTEPAEEQAALQDIETWVFDQWRCLDSTLASMAPALERYNQAGGAFQ